MQQRPNKYKDQIESTEDRQNLTAMMEEELYLKNTLVSPHYIRNENQKIIEKKNYRSYYLSQKYRFLVDSIVSDNVAMNKSPKDCFQSRNAKNLTVNDLIIIGNTQQPNQASEQCRLFALSIFKPELQLSKNIENLVNWMENLPITSN